MKKLTEKQIKQNDPILTSDIEQDIKDTERELDNYCDERDILMRNPQENKTRIYLLTGKISKRQEFVYNLQQILDYRKEL